MRWRSWRCSWPPLELVRVGAVCAEQGRPFAEIYLRPGPRELDLEDLERLDLEEAADGA